MTGQEITVTSSRHGVSVFRCIRVTPWVKKNGRKVNLNIWQSNCVICGAHFNQALSVNLENPNMVRTCKAHRNELGRFGRPKPKKARLPWKPKRKAAPKIRPKLPKVSITKWTLTLPDPIKASGRWRINGVWPIEIRGHAAQPGAGPHEQTCSTCRHCRVPGWGRRKCALMEATWTDGSETDIQGKDPACERWQRPIRNRASAEVRRKCGAQSGS